MDQLFAAIFLTLFSALVSTIDKWKKKTTAGHRKANAIAIVTLLGALVGQGLAYSSGRAATVAKINSDSLEKQKQRALDTIQAQLRSTRDSLERALALSNSLLMQQVETTSSILSDSHKLNKAQKKIDSLQNELFNNFTGGSSLPFVIISGSPHLADKKMDLSVQIKNMGTYPVYNVHLTILDYKKVARNVVILKNAVDSGIRDVDYKKAVVAETQVELIAPKSKAQMEGSFPDFPESCFAWIHTRRGAFVEKIVVLRIGESYFDGYELYDSRKRLIEKNISARTPANIKKLIQEKLDSMPAALNLVTLQ